MHIDKEGRVFLPYKHQIGGVLITPGVVREDQQIFSHCSLPEGVYRHFDVGCLIRMARTAPPFTYATIAVRLLDEDAARIASCSGIERPHLDRLKTHRLQEPGIMVLMPDGTTILVDGNHRYVRRWQMGLKTMSFVRFTEAQARRSLLAIPDELSASLVPQTLHAAPALPLTLAGSQSE